MIEGSGMTREKAGRQPEAASMPPSQPSGTGHPRVDAALAQLDQVTAQPTADQIEGYTWIHRELSETLTALDDGH